MHAVQRQKHPANVVNELLRRTQENRHSACSGKKKLTSKIEREQEERQSETQRKRKLVDHLCVHSCTCVSFSVFLEKS